jgi:hypothetical protein
MCEADDMLIGESRSTRLECRFKNNEEIKREGANSCRARMKMPWLYIDVATCAL